MSYTSLADRKAIGMEARAAVPVEAHAAWGPTSDRPDPVALLEGQNETRVPWLVPVRHKRMSVSPFTFYRGTARIMATDLSSTPVSGLEAQIIGDAHLGNFGAYASPERNLVFDSNDFDETLRGPWEWDVKRLAVSFIIAARHQGFDLATQEAVTANVVRAYQKAMSRFGSMGFLELWYEHVGVDDIQAQPGIDLPNISQRLERFSRKAKKKTSLRALRKLTEEVDGRFRIKADVPILVPIRELLPDHEPDEVEAIAHASFEAYKETLRDDRQRLLDRYKIVDTAVKVVGVGSVGTRCIVLLLEGRDRQDPLLLQAKEANASVLEEHLSPSPYSSHGERVVQGQRQIQAQSDICLGWTKTRTGKHYFVRQLRDWKGSADVESMDREMLEFYGTLCGYTLARGHARSGDPVAISAYIGSDDEFSRAIVAFSGVYADQAEVDYRSFKAAIDNGRLPVAD